MDDEDLVRYLPLWMKQEREASAVEVAAWLRKVIDSAGIDPEGRWATSLKMAVARGRVRAVAGIVKGLEGRTASRIMEGRTFSLRENLPSVGLPLGVATDGAELGGVVRLPVEDLVLHGGVYGRTGTGKSFFIDHVCACLITSGSRTWVMDAHGEHHRLIALLPRRNVRWARPQDLPICALKPVEGVDFREWSSVFVDVIGALLWLGEGGSELLLHGVRSWVTEHGMIPTLSAMLEYIQEQRFRGNSRFRGYQEAVIRTLRFLVERLPSLDVPPGRALTVDRLWQESWVFDTSQLASKESQVWVSLLLRASEYVKVEPQRFVVLEEAHRLVGQEDRSTLGESPLVRAFRELRKKRISLIVAEQNPSSLSEPVTSNLGWAAAFPIQNLKCVNTVRNQLGLSSEESAALPTLPERCALIGSRALTPPALVRVPDLVFENVPSKKELVDEARRAVREMLRENEERRRARWREAQERWAEDGGAGADGGSREGAGSGATAGSAWEAGGGGHSSAAEDGGQQYGGSGEGSRGEEGTFMGRDRTSPTGGEVRGVRRQVGQSASLEALNYLKDVMADPLLPVTVFDRKRGLAVAKGHALRQELVDGGMIEVVTIPTGKRGAQPRVVKITDSGYAALEELGVRTRRPKGKGDVVHQFWQRAIVRYLRSQHQGCEPRLEHLCADVAVQVDGRWIAFEVQSSPDHAVVNVQRDLDSGFDEVVVCAASREVLSLSKGRVDRQLGSRALAVRYGLLKTFV